MLMELELASLTVVSLHAFLPVASLTSLYAFSSLGMQYWVVCVCMHARVCTCTHASIHVSAGEVM